MSFEELLDKACSVAGLPDMARIQLPSSLSAETKEMVMKLSPDELGRVLSTAIEAVNKGAVEPIDKLVRKQVGR
jgi:hypothetical protein